MNWTDLVKLETPEGHTGWMKVSPKHNPTATLMVEGSPSSPSVRMTYYRYGSNNDASFIVKVSHKGIPYSAWVNTGPILSSSSVNEDWQTFLNEFAASAPPELGVTERFTRLWNEFIEEQIDRLDAYMIRR